MTSSLANTYFCMSTVGSNPASITFLLTRLPPCICCDITLQLSTQCLCLPVSFLLFLSIKECTVHPRGVHMVVCWWGGPSHGSPRPHSCSFTCTRLFCSIQLGWKCLVISLNSPFALVCCFSFFSLAIVPKFVIQCSPPPKWQVKINFSFKPHLYSFVFI